MYVTGNPSRLASRPILFVSPLIGVAHNPLAMRAEPGFHARQPARSAVRLKARERQLSWLRGVLAHEKKSPTAFALELGLAQNIFTRFLDAASTALLSVGTIEQIVSHTGFPGPDDRGASPGLGFGEGSQVDFAALRSEAPSHAKLLLGLTEKRPSATPWRLSTRALEGVGYRQGDLVIVEQGIAPVRGDAVCAQIYAGRTARTVFRVYEPPYLLAASLDPDLRSPILIEDGRVLIMGVVTEMLRVRAG